MAFMLTIMSLAFPVAALWSAAPAGAAAHVNLIRESEFDDVPITGEVATTFEPGDHIHGWTVSVAAVGVAVPIDGIVSGFSGPHLQFLSLKDPIAPSDAPVGKVCARVTVDPSITYKLRFASAAVNTDVGLSVRWAGRVARFLQPGSVGTTEWTQHAFLLGRFADGVAKLCFTGSGEGYPLLDKIQVFAVTP